MGEETKHLNIEQIERLLAPQPRNAGESGGLEDERTHLAACEFCQMRVSMERESDQALRALRLDSPQRASANCPPQADYYKLVGGLMDEQTCERLMDHAAECNYCGPILRLATRDLSAEQSPGEEAALASLATSQSSWQERFVSRLTAETGQAFDEKRDVYRPHWRSRWAYAASLATVLSLAIYASVIFIWHSRPEYAEGLLAHAYTERRTLEMRIPGASHAELQVTRGSSGSNLDRPATLLEAEALIARGLSKDPQSPPWIEAKVRADLLDGNVDSAVRAAESAVYQHPESASLLSDLGVAYFQRAERDRTTIDYARAFDSLSKSLKKESKDLVTRFNRAIVSERLQLFEQAESDWKYYLDLNSDPEWQKEARARLQEVEKKLEQQKKQSETPLDGPDQVAAALSSGDAQRVSEIDSMAEAYGRIALDQWIPELSGDRLLDRRRRDSLETALRLLAEDLGLRHGDSWLRDFLSESPSFPRHGLQLLLHAIQDSESGYQHSSVRLASAAKEEFGKERNEAGRLRAAFQVVYSDRLSALGRPCYEGAEPLLEELRGKNYAWIEIQTRLEAAACAVEISRVDEAIKRSQEALGLAQAAHYGNLELRAITFVADLLLDPSARFNLLRDGLVTFWAGRYDPMRGYSLYTVMDSTADDLHLWLSDEAFIKEGLRLTETNSNRPLRGLEEYRLARAQLALDETEEARRTMVEAGGLLSRNSSPTLYAGALVDLAEAFVAKHRYGDALDLLDSAEAQLSTFSQDVVLSRYYAARVAALVGEGRTVEAEHVVIPALNLADQGLASISTERDRFDWSQAVDLLYKSVAYLELSSDVERSFRWWERSKGKSIVVANVETKGDAISDWDPSLPPLGSLPGEGALLLSYGSLPEGIAVWAYDGKDVHTRWLPSSKESIHQLARHFYEGCADPRSDPEVLAVEGHRLYDAMIEPVEQWMEGRSRVIFETDVSLEPVVFEALIDRKGRYLADSYEIEYSAGMAYRPSARRSEQIGRWSRALVIGESAGNAQRALPPLPGASEEAREVAAHFDDPVVLLDHDAALDRVVKELPRAEIFHFAGHAIGSRQLDGLLLAVSPDGDESSFLGVQNFNSRLLHRIRLMVLSACSTASGSGLGLNDRDSLARNALAAGVPAVVASRWVVDSVATRAWMRSFYAQAIPTGTVSSAAKQARGAVRASSATWRHPFYWASFSVFV